MGNTEHHTSLACIEDNTKDYILYDFRYLDNLYRSITPDTVLVSIMHVNNEIGYVYDLEKISEIIKLYRKNNGTPYPYLHSDMSQSMGKLPVKNVARNLDIITASAHKFYGPLGVGFIAINKNIPLTPLIYGTQQDGLRGGTVNYPGILTASKSFLISISNMENEMRRASHYSDFIRNCLIDNFSAINAFDLNRSKINRPVVAFYPNTSPYILSFSIITEQGKFNNIKLKEKMLAKNIIIGTGSACSIGSSTVLNNLLLPHVANQGFVRLSFGRLTSDKSVRKLAKNLIYEIKKMLEEC
jgi:cysteine desulfurase